jgi:hypothetical protein
MKLYGNSGFKNNAKIVSGWNFAVRSEKIGLRSLFKTTCPPRRRWDRANRAPLVRKTVPEKPATAAHL